MKVINSLNTMTFADSKRNAESCIICLEKFKQEDIISELTCNAKHIFHASCINQWLGTKLACPLCNQIVDRNHDKDSFT